MSNNVTLESLKHHLIDHAVILGEYAPGKSMHFLYDFRQPMLTGGYLKFVGECLWNKIKKYNPTVIYGVGFGALPLLSSTQIAAESDGVSLITLIVRDERKQRNRCRLVEGSRPAYKERAVFIDDVMNYGSTYKKAKQSLLDESIVVDTVAVAVLCDFWRFSGSRQLEATGLPLERIFTRHDLGDTRIDPKNCPATESLVWRNLAENQWDNNWINAAPAIWKDKVYFANDRHQVFGHELATGNLLWEYQGDRPLRDKGIGSKLQVVDGFLYFTSYDGNICKIDAMTGEIKWKKYIDMYLHSTPYIDLERQQVYIGTEGGLTNRRGDIICIDINTATTKWIFPTKHVVPASPMLINDMVVCGSNDGNLYSLDPITGELIWMLYNIGEVKGQPAQLDDIIVVTVESGKIYGIDFDGKILWKRSCGVMSRHQFLQVHDKSKLVFVGTSGGMVVAYNSKGKQVWIRRLRADCYWNLTLYKDQLIVITIKGDINLLDPSTGNKLKFERLNYKVCCPCDFNDDYIAINSATKGFFVYRKQND